MRTIYESGVCPLDSLKIEKCFLPFRRKYVTLQSLFYKQRETKTIHLTLNNKHYEKVLLFPDVVILSACGGDDVADDVNGDISGTPSVSEKEAVLISNGKLSDGDLIYEITIAPKREPQVAVVECRPDLSAAVIPNTIKCSGTSYKVTGIDYYAFDGCKDLTSVTVGNSVMSICAAAFGECDNLTSIKVESGNSVLDSRGNCNAIIETKTNTLVAGCKSTVIPNSVTSIGEGAFYGCYSLTSITIPNSVTSIGKAAFYACTGLTDVTCLAYNPPTIDYAFAECDKLKTLHILPLSKAAYVVSDWKQWFENIVDDAHE